MISVAGNCDDWRLLYYNIGSRFLLLLSRLYFYQPLVLGVLLELFTDLCNYLLNLLLKLFK
jgi:hypothetical protein